MDMEMIQYHPTTLAENGFLITEGARGEGAHLYNALGERFMEKYAPNKLELASRDVVSRAEQTEINEGRGFPDGTIALDITKVPRKRTLEALREIVNIGKDFAGVDITREPIHIKPGMHYIMGGVKTDFDGQTPIPGLYAAGEVACVSVHGGNRLGANSLLDTLIFGRRSGEHAAARARGVAMPKSPGSVLADAQGEIDAILDRPTGGRRISEIKNELGETMNRYVAVYRDAEGLATALEIVQRLKQEAPNAAIDDKGTIFNQDVLGGDRARLHARRGRGDRDRGAGAQRVARGAVPHRLPRAQRRRLAAPHHGLAERRRPESRHRAGDDHPLGAAGADVLGDDRDHGRVHAEAPALRPPVGRGALLRGVPGRPRAAPLGARGDPQVKGEQDGSVGIRCSCRAAICGSCGVRINGKAGLACHTHLDHAAKSGVNADGKTILVEPMGNMPVIKDLIVDMDAVHWKKIQRVTPWLINKQPVPEREYVVPHENMVDVTQTMACIQCGACVSDCLSMEVDPLFVGPAASAKAYRFVGDPRDAEQYERLKDLAEDPHGIYDCTHCFNCIEACPKGVAPMSQIMRLRRIAAATTTSSTATTASATSARSSA